MRLIRVTFENGDKRFLSEYNPFFDSRFQLHEKVTDGQVYNSLEEFRIVWRLINNSYFIEDGEEYYNAWRNINHEHDPEKIVKFETFDTFTLESEEFDINKKYHCEDTIYLSPQYFDILKQEPAISSSHYTFSGDEWVAFPKKEDMDRIDRVEFYYRFVSYLFQTMYLHRHYSVPSCYRYNVKYKKLMSHPDIIALYLAGGDSCHRFTALPMQIDLK